MRIRGDARPTETGTKGLQFIYRMRDPDSNVRSEGHERRKFKELAKPFRAGPSINERRDERRPEPRPSPIGIQDDRADGCRDGIVSCQGHELARRPALRLFDLSKELFALSDKVDQILLL